MSKKTRRQKEAIQVNKLQKQTSSLSSSKAINSNITSVQDTYFKKDLNKSILISSIIFMTLTGIYLADQYGFMTLSNLIK